MLRFLLLVAAFVCPSCPVWAQRLESDLGIIQGPVRDGGTFHVATGTWTHNQPPGFLLGPDTVYNNTAYTANFSGGHIAMVTSSFDLVMAGRIPSTSGGAGANRDNYNLNGVSIRYCIDDDALATGPLDVQVTLYPSYVACEDPADFQIAGQFVGAGLPGSDPAQVALGYFTCWTVQFDLTGAEICVPGDGDGVFNNALAFDSFGFGLEFDPGGTGGYVGAITVGPVLAGDRDWTARAAGEITPPSPGGGGGGGATYYGPAEICVPTLGGENSTGYDTEDLWWTGDRSSAGIAAGCFWFWGGSGPGCNANGTYFVNPPANMYALLTADTTGNCLPVGGLVGTAFCDPNSPNSTGFPCHLAGLHHPGVGSGLHLEATAGPAAEFGYFLVGNAPSAGVVLPNNGGQFCLDVTMGNGFGRYNVTGSSLNSIGQFDGGGTLQNLVGTAQWGSGFDVPSNLPIAGSPAITAGSTWHFQLWYRDVAVGAGWSNFSNALSMTF